MLATGPSGVARLPVFQTVRAAYGFVFSHPGDLLRIALWPALIAVAAWTFIDWMESQGHSGSIGVVANILYAWFGFFWHRRVLIGPDAARLSTLSRLQGESGFGQSKWFNRFLMRAILFGLLIFLLVGLPAGVAMFALLGDSGLDETTALLAILAIVFGLYYLLSPFFLRFALMFPAIAVGGAAGWNEAWQLSAGNSWRLANIFALSFLLYLPLFVLLFAVASFLPVLGVVSWIVGNCLAALVSFPITAIQVTCLSLAYKELAPVQYRGALAEHHGEAAEAAGALPG